MVKFVFGFDAEVAHFVAQLMPESNRDFPPSAKAIGIVEEDGGELVAGVVYHNWEPEAAIIEISGAALPGKNWISRETLRTTFGYPFFQLGIQMIVQRTRAEDERLLRQLAALNYYFISIPRMFGRDKDGVLCCLTLENWLDNKFNRRDRRHEKQEVAA